jgi:putative DNA primase/helicase
MSEDINRVRSALSVIPADGYDNWVRIAMAIKSEYGDSGFELFDEWSSKGEKYTEKSARVKWRNISGNGGTTIGTLFHEAKNNGWSESTSTQNRAESIWEFSEEAPESHPYLVKKGIKPHGIRVTNHGQLITPIYISGRLTSLQFISREGKKVCLKDSPKKGGYFIVGNIESDTMCIAEGFATAATIVEATRYPTVVSFGTGELLNVSREMRKLYPGRKIILCADNDKPGLAAATKAAKDIGGYMAIPTSEGDFNDMRDHAAVLRAIENASPMMERILYTFREIMEEKLDQRWLFEKYLLDQPQLVEIFGEPGSGKTLLALDLALCIATGEPWAGITPGIPGAVVYIYGEGGIDLKKRIIGWASPRGINYEEMEKEYGHIPFLATKTPIRIGGPKPGDQCDELKRNIDFFSRQHGSPKLVIVDTVSRNMIGNENATEEMAGFVAKLSENIIHNYGCNNLVLHHPGRENKDYSRGNTALLGAIDAQFKVSMDDDIVRFECGPKQPRSYSAPEDKFFRKDVRQVYNYDRSRLIEVAGLVHVDDPKEIEDLPHVQIVRELKKSSQRMISTIEKNGGSMNMDDLKESLKKQYLRNINISSAFDELGARGIIKIQQDDVFLIS